MHLPNQHNFWLLIDRSLFHIQVNGAWLHLTRSLRHHCCSKVKHSLKGKTTNLHLVSSNSLCELLLSEGFSPPVVYLPHCWRLLHNVSSAWRAMHSFLFPFIFPLFLYCTHVLVRGDWPVMSFSIGVVNTRLMPQFVHQHRLFCAFCTYLTKPCLPYVICSTTQVTLHICNPVPPCLLNAFLGTCGFHLNEVTK